MKYKNPGDLYNAFQAKKKKSEFQPVTRAEQRTKKKNWIAGAIKHPGALHRQLGVKQGEKIPAKTLAKAAKKGGVEGKRARLAETLKSFHRKKNKKETKTHEHSESKSVEKKEGKKEKVMCKRCKREVKHKESKVHEGKESKAHERAESKAFEAKEEKGLVKDKK